MVLSCMTLPGANAAWLSSTTEFTILLCIVTYFPDRKGWLAYSYNSISKSYSLFIAVKELNIHCRVMPATLDYCLTCMIFVELPLNLNKRLYTEAAFNHVGLLLADKCNYSGRVFSCSTFSTSCTQRSTQPYIYSI